MNDKSRFFAAKEGSDKDKATAGLPIRHFTILHIFTADGSPYISILLCCLHASIYVVGNV